MSASSGYARVILRVAIVALALALLLWLGARSENWRYAYQISGPAADYYNLLADGLIEGHTYAKAEVHPDLLSPDPLVRDNAPSLLDLSLYRGKYYLYFGVVPAVTVFLPYLILTGGHLDQGLATWLFVAVGIIFQLAIFARARRAYFPGIPWWLEAASLALLVFGSALPSLIFAGGSYEVAIAGAYTAMSVGFWAVYAAVHTRRHLAACLSLAGLTFGLAVGCRPTTLFALPVVLAGGYGLMARARRQRRAEMNASLLRPWLMYAVAPAAVVGLFLAGYNYARFGDPTQFGFKYQVNAMMKEHFPFAELSFFWPNLKWYYLTPPVISPFFPYSFPINAEVRPPNYYGYEVVHGQWLSLVLFGLCFIGWVGRRKGQDTPHMLRFFWVLGLASFVCLYLSLAFFGARADRYVVDFHSPFVLVITLMMAYAWTNRAKKRLAFLGAIAAAVIAACSASLNLFAGMQTLERFAISHPKANAFLSYYGNYPSHLLAQSGFFHYGPVELRVRFPAVEADHILQPLVSMGVPSQVDQLSVLLHRGNNLQLRIEHQRYPGTGSAVMPYNPDHDYVIRLDVGSLYPPKEHPFFRGWSDAEKDSLKSRTHVWLDGRQVIGVSRHFYEAPPNRIYFGKNQEGDGAMFTGVIREVRRLPAADLASVRIVPRGGWRFDFTLPRVDQTGPQPLLASGKTGAGNLLLLQLVTATKVRFKLDCWNYEFSQSDEVELGNTGPHVFEVFVGPAAAAYPWPAQAQLPVEALRRAQSTLRIWVDGKPVWTTRILGNGSSYDLVTVGANVQGFSSAISQYQGDINEAPWDDGEIETFIRKNLEQSTPP